MRLKQIKLAGFKSFVDPTTFSMPSQLVGVVGPNGCGKSNVIDAVRWVMGESSAKHLRGDSMADVIFNGSTSRKPVSQAMVEIVFDNAEGTLGGQYAAYNEISVKRQVTRDGQSQYFLNGTRCRRRDITDIFLGTGLGTRSYAIIEQGTISRLVEAKPEDLRVFLEEAAGISKYKERRRETELRIQHTRDNLNRLNDIREEIDKRLQTLQRQAKVAEKYQELKHQERTLRAQLLALRWRGLDSEARAQEQALLAQHTALEAQIAELRRVEAALETARAAHIEANDACNAVQGRYYQTSAEIARLEQALQHAKETRTRQRQELERVTHEARGATDSQQHDQTLIETLTAQLAADNEAVTLARAQEQTAASELTAAEQALHAWQQAWDEFNTQANAQVRTAEVARTRLQHLEQNHAQHQQRRTRGEQELATLSTTALSAELAELTARRTALDGDITTLQQRAAQDLAASLAERDRHRQLGAELSSARGELQGLQGRLAALETAQQQALGKRPGAVLAWLNQHGLADRQRLAQALDVTPGWERAVERVLGVYLEAVCVSGVASVTDALSTLTHGRLGVFDTAMAASPTTAAAAGERLLDKVSAPWSLESLLGAVYVADDLAQALALRERLAAHESVITRDGLWLGRAWLNVVRDGDDKAGVLAREHELRDLHSNATRTRERITTLEHALQASQDALRAAEEGRERSQRAVAEAQQRRAELHSQAGGKQARLEQFHSRAERLRAELAELDQQSQQAHTEAETVRARLHEALAAAEIHTGRRAELLAGRDTHRAAVEGLRAQVRSTRDAVHALALRLEGARGQLAMRQAQVRRSEDQLRQLATRRAELEEALATAEQPLATMAAEFDGLLAQRLRVEAELAEARRQVEAHDQQLREFNATRQRVEQQSQAARATLDQARLHGQELQIRRETVHEQIVASEFQLEPLLAEMPETANEAEWQAQAERVTQQIQRLGAINLAAIEECAEQSERKTYLDAQHKDLFDALETLEGAMRKIDRETRDRFRETFDKVNAGLQAMFPRLFGGGQAYLEMTGDDILSTGVTVMARPPGKRNSTIHLLSGGEKALTAVAMVFAIFELNPAPFCMLDEVDAPLDEANVGRFCQLVKEMSERIQFIFITHNKATMEMAQHLTGVTMHEPGVSRLVTVDVEQAVELAAVGT